ncbi:hypothetical protein BDF20DRAFT_868102 [Mycotypha africana]|uniref:uncharacterized protein n=1 Tax=Mycotypha africana TaxID=64632 RepID=UPI0023001AE3|nr:uncharacterized protein BDF20DRAFT_868102 [Mycotypha africana]KAI8979190.1 hypothetical protein BDF20DRAFT_868102 [Mycotypha africana]
MSSNADDERAHMLPASNEPSGITLLSSIINTTALRTQHSLTKSEIVSGMANRFMYSKFYIGLYLSLAMLSFITIIMSLKETCPTALFIVFEAIINFAMIMEVIIRLLALGKRYWKSLWNIIDIILVGLCAITLIVLTTGCSVSERNEAIFDTVLLVIRNGFQLVRLFMMLRKNQYSLNARSTRIDFDDIPDIEERNPSLEFTALDRENGLEDNFMDVEDTDVEHGRFN